MPHFCISRPLGSPNRCFKPGRSESWVGCQVPHLQPSSAHFTATRSFQLLSPKCWQHPFRSLYNTCIRRSHEISFQKRSRTQACPTSTLASTAAQAPTVSIQVVASDSKGSPHFPSCPSHSPSQHRTPGNRCEPRPCPISLQSPVLALLLISAHEPKPL